MLDSAQGLYLCNIGLQCCSCILHFPLTLPSSSLSIPLDAVAYSNMNWNIGESQGFCLIFQRPTCLSLRT